LPERISITYHLDADPGVERDIPIYRVQGGRTLRTIQTNVSFPVGQYGELEISFYRGIRKLLPTVGVYTGDNMMITDNTPAEWGTDENVIMHYKNTNTTERRESYITIEGELFQPEE